VPRAGGGRGARAVPVVGRDLTAHGDAAIEANFVLVVIVYYISWGHKVKHPLTNTSPALCNWWVHYLPTCTNQLSQNNNVTI
jgi:hypothetical protein